MHTLSSRGSEKGLMLAGWSARIQRGSLSRAGRYLEAFFSHSVSPLALLDTDFNFIRVNEAYAKACGRAVQDFRGRNHFEFYPHEENEGIFRQVVRTKRPYVALRKPFNFPDHPEWGVTYWDWNLFPVLDGAGEVDFLVFSLSDVTAREKAERELQRQRDGLENLVQQRTREVEEAKAQTSERVRMRADLLAETASQLLRAHSPQRVVDALCGKVMSFLDCHAFFNFLVDEKSSRLHLNACAGIPQAEAQRIEWLDYGIAVCGCVAREGHRIVAEDIQNTPDLRTELVKSYGMQAYACHPLLAQGCVLGTLSFGTRSRTHFSDEDLALMKAVSDLVAIAMQRQRHQEQLERTNAKLEIRVAERTQSLQEATDQLNAFVYTVAHDLKAPLRAQVAFSQMLLEEFGEQLGPDGADYARRVHEAACRQDKMVQDLLTHLKLSRAELPMEPVDISRLVEQVRADLTLDIERQHGTVSTGPLDGKALANPSSLHLVIQNLVSNGLKYVADGVEPRVRVWTERRGGFVRLWVEDNGIGIEEKYRQKLFGLFQRLHTGPKYPGTGIGLAIVKKAAERMGGSVGFESEPGKGSRFWIELQPADKATA